MAVPKGKAAEKRAILSLIERGGNVRTFHIAQATKVNVSELLSANIAHESVLMTDEWPAAGFVDTEIRCLTELESGNAKKEVQPRVQA